MAVALLTQASPAAAIENALYAWLLLEHTSEVEDLARVRVDYQQLRGSAEWSQLVRSLERSQPKSLSTREERLAFWINAYNILAIGIVQQNYPVGSIKDIGSFFSPVWDRPAGRIAGESYRLGQIEHEILRPMGDPRIHGAIVCASLSCPPLQREPFRAETLDAQLDAHLRSWPADTRKGVRVDAARNTLVVSKTFRWFEEDFEVRGGVEPFIGSYLSEEAAAGLGSRPRLEYFDYDWSLNRLN